MPLSRPGARLAFARHAAARKYLQIAEKYTPSDVEVCYRKTLTGCAWARARKIAAPRPITRRALHVYLHEVAHVVLEHYHVKSEHVQEYEAELWAFEVMSAERIPIPAKSLRRAKDYVAYLVHEAFQTGLEVDERALSFSDYLAVSAELRTGAPQDFAAPAAA